MTKQRTTSARKLSPDKPGFHILLAIIVTVIIFVLAILFLRLFTRHGHEIEMPSYLGRSAEELTQHGRSEGFVFEVSDELYEQNARPGTVLKQNPQPGEKVKHGRKVYLNTYYVLFKLVGYFLGRPSKCWNSEICPSDKLKS